MKSISIRVVARFLLLLFVSAVPAFAQTRTVRIVTYNIQDDTSGNTTPLPGLIAPYDGGTTLRGGVLEGIGQQVVGGSAQPLDILALQETTSNATTVSPIVDGLNAYYNAPGMYAMSPFQATSSGGVTSGGGPSALVYNTTTVQLLASAPVDPPGGKSQLGSASGEYREVIRYKFAPAGVTPSAANTFYIYVSHYKASTGSANELARLGEAQIIRTDEANNLPADARVVYVGDYNVTSSGEAGYQTILAPAAPNGAPQGQGFDPLNPTGSSNINWSVSTSDKTILAMLTESATSLRYRDDLQLMTSNVFYGVPGGLAYVAGSYHTFGNNGSITYSAKVTSSANTALTNIPPGAPISAATLYHDLTNASDHLPVVADYTIPLPVAPPVASFSAAPTSGTQQLAVSFSDTSTGSVTNRFWNFGDGATTNTSATNLVHVYAAGTFTASLTVQGPGGASSNSLAGISVLTPFQAWQVYYFGSVTNSAAAPAADADGTGQNNQFKFVAGLNPTNPASVFVLSASPQPGAVRLTFSPLVSGRTYTPQFRTNLGSGPWLPLTTAALPWTTNGTTVTITDTNPAAGEFYRVGISMP
jgi:PKD repeat protein